MKNCETILKHFSALEKVCGRNSHIAKKESENFSLQKFHIVHALVFVEIRVFIVTRFVSCVPTHTSSWILGIDVEDIGFLNTKLWSKDCSRSKNSSYQPSQPPGIFPN